MELKEFKGLDPYKGELDCEQAAEGIEAAKQNANSLVEDAKLLYENGRYPRSVALSLLAIEEAGKTSIIRGIILANSQKQLKSEWKAYRSHTKKNVMGAFFDNVTEHPYLEDFRPLFDPKSAKPKVLDSLKQISFYSDCVGKGRWIEPQVMVDKNLAEIILKIASFLASNRITAMESAEELKLWVKHMKPVWVKDMQSMKLALIDCYKEAAELGVLKGNESAEDMAKFTLSKIWS